MRKKMVVMFLGMIMAANMNVHAAQPVKTLEDLGVTEKGGCGIVKYLTKRHLNVNPSVKRWEMTGNPDKSRVVANLNGKK